MTMKMTLQTQRDLLQQSNIEIPQDAYLIRQGTANQTFSAGVSTAFSLPTVLQQFRITTPSSTTFVVPDTGFYHISISAWWTGAPAVTYNASGSGATDIEVIGNTTIQNATISNVMYINAGVTITMVGVPGTATTSNFLFGRPLLKVKKLR